MVDPVKQGVASLSAGDFESAVSAFREALTLAPNSAANHVNLAYALQETRAPTEALSHLQRAVALDATSFDAHYMLGIALEREGEHAAAAGHLRTAVSLRPTFEPAHADLCRVLAAAGDTSAARQAINAAIALNPLNADFHHYLGNVCMTDGDHDGAAANYRRALDLQPGYAKVHANLGLALRVGKDFEAAAESFERAIAIDPKAIEAMVNLGITRKVQGRLDDASRALEGALALEPDHAEALNSLAMTFQEQGLLERAVETYRKAISLRPDQPGGYANLGLALYDKGEVSQAVAIYRQGLAIRPIAEMHDNLAIALQKQGAVDEAIEHYRLALALQPDNLNTQCNLAAALADGGGPHESIAAYRKILEVKPDHLVAHSNLLFNLTFYENCTPEQYLEEARRFDEKLKRGLLEPPPAPSDAPAKRLRVGFVSGDLVAHPVGYFLEGILHHLEGSDLDLFAYPTIAKEDDLSRRIRPRFKRWQMLKGLSDEAAARAIRADAIDILIDLSGHTAHTRLPMFALRPAPVQISWLGYFASTGVSEIDYILADPLCVPEGEERFMREKVWRLPETRLCYTPPPERSTPVVAPLPASSRGHITFGCFQRFPKISDAVLALWGDVFRAIPQARLLLQSHQSARPVFIQQMQQRLAAVGIAAERIWILPPAERIEYLRTYGEVDIVLDTFPYNGGTTTCEALWMGVPTLTLRGETMLARQGAALLTAGGLADWVATDRGEFVSKAAAFAGDVPGLSRDDRVYPARPWWELAQCCWSVRLAMR